MAEDDKLKNWDDLPPKDREIVIGLAKELLAAKGVRRSYGTDVREVRISIAQEALENSVFRLLGVEQGSGDPAKFQKLSQVVRDAYWNIFDTAVEEAGKPKEGRARTDKK